MPLLTVGGVLSVHQEHLWREGDRESPRFTLLIVDVAGDEHASVVPCAVVLIPRGRDRDFTFSSLEGLQQARAKESKARPPAPKVSVTRFCDGEGGNAYGSLDSDLRPYRPLSYPRGHLALLTGIRGRKIPLWEYFAPILMFTR